MVSMDAGEVGLQEAIAATASLFLDLPEHVVVGPMPVGSISPLDLPLKDLNEASHSIKHFVDLILDIPVATLDLENLKPIFRDQSWDALPEVMKFKTRPHFDTIVQYVILPQADGQALLLKHVYVATEKVTGKQVADVIHGSGREIAWGQGNKKIVRKAFQWMLEQLGGIQFRHWSLTPEKKKPVSCQPTLEDDGWTFLREHGELDKSDLKQLRWIHHHINLPNCPIQGWSERLVQKALDSLANDGAVAKLCSRYDLTIGDIEPDVLEVLEQLVPYLRDHSIWLLGEAGKGKTPLGRILAMMFSRYWGGEGCFRTTSDLDFFRGVPFAKHVPALYDDGSIGDEETKKKKAYSDVTDEESMTRARWTNAKFVRNQLRIVLDNSYNPDAEPEDEGTESSLEVLHKDFFLMIRPALGSMSRTDAMAILKRAAFIVFGKEHVYFRVPSEQQISAHRIRWKKVDIILDTSKPTLRNFKEGGPVPADYARRSAWEAVPCLDIMPLLGIGLVLHVPFLYLLRETFYFSRCKTLSGMA